MSTDPVMRYSEMVGNDLVCNYCGWKVKGGGVTRMKYHLTGNDPNRNAKKCMKCPLEVATELQSIIDDMHNKRKGKKTVDEVLRRTARSSDCGEDSDSDDQEVRDMIRAMKKSRAESYKIPSGRGGSSYTPDSQRLKASQLYLTPSLYKTDTTKQKRLPEMVNPKLNKKLGRLVSKFFIYENIPINKADSYHFKNMMAGAQDLGPGVSLPSSYEILNTYLDQEVKEIEERMEVARGVWEQYGCTIMADGWTGPTHLSIINFLIYSNGNTVYINSVDASGDVKDWKFLYKQFQIIIEKVGKHNVVQVVTDNGNNFVKAGKKLMERYKLYWTPCAAHSFDLMLEDIGKHASCSRTIQEAREVTKFVYNHNLLLNKTRETCNGDIVRPGVTRYATNYLAMNSLLEKKNALKNIFGSDWWQQQKLSEQPKGVMVKERIFTAAFWERVKTVTDIFEPIYKSLQWVDTEVFPTMGVMYQLYQTMKKQIEEHRNSDWLVRIINKRWEKNLCHPLHEAAFYLNPSIQYDSSIPKPDSCKQAVMKVFEKLYKNDPNIGIVGVELLAFRDAKGAFKMSSAIASRGKMPPAEWWNMFGTDTPTLTKLAVRILAQTVSSSACERNWSTFALVHTKQRNRLAYKTLEELVYCSYNMKLMLRDNKAIAENVLTLDLLDMIQQSMERMGPMDDDELVNWIRPAHLDDENGRPDPIIREQAIKLGIDIDQAAIEAGIKDPDDTIGGRHNDSDDNFGSCGDDGSDGGDDNEL